MKSDQRLVVFGKYVSWLREKAGIKTLKELSDLSEVPQSTISRMEAGLHKPKPETLEALAPHLDVTYVELMKKVGYLPEAIQVPETPPAYLASGDLLSDLDEDEQKIITNLIERLKAKKK